VNIFNRVLAVALLLFFALVGVMALGALIGFQLNLPGAVFHFLRGELSPLSSFDTWHKSLAGFITVVCICFLLLLVGLELRRPRNESPIVLSTNEYGVVSVSRQSAERLGEWIGSSVGAVQSMRCTVRSRRKGLRVRCEPVLTLGASLDDNSSEIQNAVKNGLEKSLGIPVYEVIVKAHYESLEVSRTRTVIGGAR
jgi:uncharacterized alkaline shock family protein YloU